MSTEERLARIEQALLGTEGHVIEIKSMLMSLGSRVENTERTQIELKAQLAADIKILRIGVGLALLGGVGGGGALISRLLGVG